jgi:hypothetical protein
MKEIADIQKEYGVPGGRWVKKLLLAHARLETGRETLVLGVISFRAISSVKYLGRGPRFPRILA